LQFQQAAWKIERNNQGDADAGVDKRDSIDLESEIDQEPVSAAFDYKVLQALMKNQRDADAGVDKRDSIDLESEIDQEPESAAFDNSKHHLRIEEESEGVSCPDPLANAARAPVPAGVKLARSGMGNVARVKDLPQVITPTVLVVKEQASDGALSYHAVAGQKTLKDWARTQATTSEFDVVGLLMPKAAGKTLRDADVRMTVVSRADLKPMASSALNLLKGLASHGFIHGDIKPANLIWDTKSKTLQLIDNDSLKKVSKQNGSQVKADVKQGVTPMYLNPVGFHSAYSGGKNEQLGLGRDLFAMGLTLLEASLHARGQAAKAEKIIAGITFNDQPDGKAIYKKQFGNYDDGIKALMAEEFAPGSVDAFARSCIIKSIEHEKGRLGLDENDNVVLPRTATFDRYDPNRAGNDQHLLAQLERDLALLT
jgi:serine/threonine protein kinase